jgi:hypothetical protein
MQKKTLFCLANAGISAAPENLKLPSWVADWSHDNERKSIITAGGNFNATRGSQPILSISEDKQLLTIRGFMLDVVSELNRVYAGRERIEMDPTLVQEQKRKALNLKRAIQNSVKLANRAHKFPEGQNSEEALWRTLCCDLTPDIPPSRAPQEFGKGFQLLLKFLDAMKEDGTYNFDHEVYKSPEFLKNNLVHNSVFMNAVQKFTIGRNMCVTAGGFLGRVPMGSAIGDKICILFGGCVPFVLRDSDGGYFKFIGECYIHGIMDGEAMEGLDTESMGENFEIR